MVICEDFINTITIQENGGKQNAKIKETLQPYQPKRNNKIG